MAQDLTQGPILKGLMRFSLPLMAGNLLQQSYNLADAWVVGRFCGETALGAVGSAFAVMVLVTSIVNGLCMGAGVVVSQLFGQQSSDGMRRAAGNALTVIGLISLLLTALVYLLLDPLVALLRVPPQAAPLLRSYLAIVFAGIVPTYIYNFAASMLRALGSSVPPLMLLTFSTVTNIALDLALVARAGMGVEGAALATLISQALCAALSIVLYVRRAPAIVPRAADLKPQRALCRRILSVSALTSIQQSIMNFGILMVQSLVNSFGVEAMAAFAAGVKIDAFAYAPAQDFGNGFATFVAQNRGANQWDRLRRGVRMALTMSIVFCLVISCVVGLLARPLLTLFLPEADAATLAIGVTYLRTEGLCYAGIGVLFLLYATWRGLERAGMSIVLTVISLGLRVALAYALAPAFGLTAVWLSIPIGWVCADAVGLIALRHRGVLNRQDA